MKNFTKPFLRTSATAIMLLGAIVAVGCNKGGGNRGSDYDNQLSFHTSNDIFASWPAEVQLPCLAYNPAAEGAPYYDLMLSSADAGASWNTDQIVLQPGFPLAYYAWWPTTTVTALAADPGVTSGASFGYVVAADPANQEELVAANVTTSLSSVELKFRRLLSQVSIVAVEIPGVTVSLSEVRVNGVANSGAYTFGEGTDAGSWSAVAGSATYNYVFGGDPLILMPQIFAENSAPGHVSDATLTFGYTLTPTEGAPQSGTGTLNFGDAALSVRAWEMGAKYVYSVDFSAVLQGGAIGYSVEPDHWTDENVMPISGGRR